MLPCGGVKPEVRRETGLRCPFCQTDESKVVDSRATEDGSSIRRRRECSSCRKRFTTYERIEERPLLVIKKNGEREHFERSKILNGIMRACEKRPVSLEQMESMTADIENALRDRGEREVESVLIGEMVMEKLRNTDEVAYVRFASVYRQFKDLNSFISTIQQLKSSLPG